MLTEEGGILTDLNGEQKLEGNFNLVVKLFYSEGMAGVIWDLVCNTTERKTIYNGFVFISKTRCEKYCFGEI